MRMMCTCQPYHRYNDTIGLRIKDRTHDATLRAIAELHRVSTFAIAACNVAGVEASSTSVTFHATIARNGDVTKSF